MEFFPTNAAVFAQGGRASDVKELLEALANGDPIAWTVVIGLVVIFVLAPVVAIWWRRFHGTPAAVDPAQVVASWQKRRGLCFLALVLAVGAFFLGAIVCISLDNVAGGVAFASFVFAGVFISLVMLLVNARCPACGSSMGRNWSPAFCPKCGVPLKETERAVPGEETPPAASQPGAKDDDGPRS